MIHHFIRQRKSEYLMLGRNDYLQGEYKPLDKVDDIFEQYNKMDKKLY